MDQQVAYEMIQQDGIVAVMRGAFVPEVAVRTATVLLEQGIHVFELTFNSEQPIAAMQAVKEALGDDACVGMGTLFEVDDAQRVIDAGPDFMVTPAFVPDVVQLALDADILIAPAVATTTEAAMAWKMGVKVLKLFPVGVLGIDYFKVMTGPLSHMKFMCNGGMNADNTAPFIQAGAVACGVSSWLTGTGSMADETLRNRAVQLKAAVDRGRGVPKSV